MDARRGDSFPVPAAETGIVVTRAFDAPRELVFRAWIEPQRLMRWWDRLGESIELVPWAEVAAGREHFGLGKA